MRLPSLEVQTGARAALVDVTAQIRAALRKAGVRSGILVAFVPHTTSGITIQENAVPERPARGTFRHGEGNSDAHVKTSLVGSSATILVEEGDLVLGTWQGVYLCEFDGPRRRIVHLTVVPG